MQPIALLKAIALTILLFFTATFHASSASLTFSGTITTPDFTPHPFESRLSGIFENSAAFHLSFTYDTAPDAFFISGISDEKQTAYSVFPAGTLEISSGSGYHYTDHLSYVAGAPMIDTIIVSDNATARDHLPAGDSWSAIRLFSANDAPTPGDVFYGSQVNLVFDANTFKNEEFFIVDDLSSLIYAEFALTEILIGPGSNTVTGSVRGIADLTSAQIVPAPSAVVLFFSALIGFRFLRRPK